MALHDIECPAPCARSPFEDPPCLRLIHDYLGAGHYSFIAPVSKLWKQSYEDTPSLRATGFVFTGGMREQISFLCDCKTTLYSYIFTSTSRVRLAKELQASLRLTYSGLGKAAGIFAELSVFKCAVNINLLSAGTEPSSYAIESLTEGAALAADLRKLRWLHTQKGYPITSAVSERAASSGSVHILKWLAGVCDDKVVHTKEVMTAACANGHIHTVEYLLDRACASSVNDCCEEAARRGHLDLLIWMLSNVSFNNNVNIAIGSMMQGAAAGGSIEVLEWLRYEHFVQFDESLIPSAAHYNQLAMIQYLRAAGCPCDASACTAAVMCFSYSANTQSNSAATLQWLHEHGCPWNLTEVHRLAAERGNIGVLS
jgi:hypothetical protein